MTTPDYMVETDNLNGVPQPNINPPSGFNAPPTDYGSTHEDQPIRPIKQLGTLCETMTGTQYPNDPVFGAFTATALKRNLCHIEAGIKIADLYTMLEKIPANNPSITTSGDGLWHGYTLKTLGGSGGQAVVGAVTTSVHGGDYNDTVGNPIRPLPDMVQGIHLVGTGGIEYFIQRGGSRAIVDPVRLGQLDSCLAGPGQIITDDDTFNAVVVSMGRMGIIYSVVLEVRPQFFLTETVHNPCRWKQLSSSVVGTTASGQTIGDFRADPGNRFLNVMILPYIGWEQSQIGNNYTASTPFVVPDPNGNRKSLLKLARLMQTRTAGGIASKLGRTWPPPPTVSVRSLFLQNGAWVYFRGTDNALWKVRDDGSQQVHITNPATGKQYTSSTPFVVPDPSGAWIYYQGTDNALWKIRDDGSQQSQIGGNNTSSTPFVVPDPNGGAWVYFRGTDNALWKIRDDGSQQIHITNPATGKQYTSSTPFVVPDPSGAWIYYQGTDNTLWKIRDDGSQQSTVGGNTTASTPFVVLDPNGVPWVYFQGTDIGLNNPGGPGTLWKVRDDPDHTCFVTTRCEVPPTSPNVPATSLGDVIFNYVCELPPAGLVGWVSAAIAAIELFAAGTAALLSLIPFVGPILAAFDIAAAQLAVGILSPLLTGKTIGDYLAAAVNLLTQLGNTDLATNLVNQIMSGARPTGQSKTDISFRIMDTVDYKANCYKALALEVGFNADDTAYVSYLSAVFDLISSFKKQNILYGGYISLRYCAGSEALLAMEQWPHTICIEFGALAHLNNEQEVLNKFEDETMNHVGADGRLPTVHWGQLNTRTRSQIEAIFPAQITRWRSALARLSSQGNPNTFDNDFCSNHGLEVS